MYGSVYKVHMEFIACDCQGEAKANPLSPFFISATCRCSMYRLLSSLTHTVHLTCTFWPRLPFTQVSGLIAAFFFLLLFFSSFQSNLTKQQNGFKITLKTLEDNLLSRLSSASGNFLGDTELVENLEITKHTAAEIEEKVVQFTQYEYHCRGGCQ